jgi:hypothetical protein
LEDAQSHYSEIGVLFFCLLVDFFARLLVALLLVNQIQTPLSLTHTPVISICSIVSLDGIVETLLSDMKGRGLAEHINTARDLLTFKIEK